MTKRKTIKVAELVEVVNEMLLNSTADAIDYRQGMIAMISDVLHRTGNYNGFRYLTSGEVKCCPPGINYVDGMPHPDEEARFKGTDSTRVQYF